MGKKSRFKHLRKISANLPEVAEKTFVSEKVEGHQLIENGIDTVNDKPVKLGGIYRKVTAIAKPVNHYRKLKQLDKTGGVAAVIGYLDKFQPQKQAL